MSAQNCTEQFLHESTKMHEDLFCTKKLLNKGTFLHEQTILHGVTFARRVIFARVTILHERSILHGFFSLPGTGQNCTMGQITQIDKFVRRVMQKVKYK